MIAGDSGGAPETVIDGVTGVVVGGRDVGKLGVELVRLLGERDAARKLGRAGREHVEANWTWPAMGQRLRNILNPIH